VLVDNYSSVTALKLGKGKTASRKGVLRRKKKAGKGLEIEKTSYAFFGEVRARKTGGMKAESGSRSW